MDSHIPCNPVWQRCGVMFSPEQLSSGWSGHCQMPTPLVLANGRLRFFFCSRDRRNKSHTLWVDVENHAPWKIIDVAREPILSPSKPGLFDAEGVMPSSIIQFGERLLMYTIGWTVRSDVPYHNAIGLCESFDGGLSWERVSAGPVHAQGLLEPYFCGTSEVVLSSDGHALEMYYMSATEWREVRGKLEPRYCIRKAVSKDGIHWSQDNPVIVDYLDEDEGGIARATLLSKDGRARWMWYCHRGINGYRRARSSAYKIGVSYKKEDGGWTRLAQRDVFSEPARDNEFDSVMECYPINHHSDGKDWLFYNGNGFGQTGIGFAVLLS